MTNYELSCTHQISGMGIQNDEYIRVILIISATYTHSYLFLITYSHYLHSKFGVLILLILNNTNDITDFDSP